MSNAIALKPEQTWTPEQMKLITDVVARNATPAELQFFLYRCKNMGLDPLKPGQIHFVKYTNGPGTIVVGIEGFRTIAHRSGKLSGIKRGAIKNEVGELVGAWAEVYRTDWTHPAREETPLSEYDTGRGPWQKMKETMIKKVAEAAALRMAFPDDLGGTYIHEEMDQAKPVVGNRLVVPEQPEVGDANTTDEYCVPYGPLAKKPISQCDPAKLKAYILEREESYRKNNNKPGTWFLELLKHAEPLIAEYEGACAEPGSEG